MTTTRFLSNREAHRLLLDWGFVPIKTKGKHAGGHAFYAYRGDGPRVSITAPGRKADTPPAAYKKAAQIVGVSVPEFLAGPPKHPTSSEPDIPVVEEQIMRTSSGAVQTPINEFSDRVLYVLQEAEEPMAYGHLSGAAGLQSHRGETVARALEYLQSHGVTVKEEFRRAKGGRAFKVVCLAGSKADQPTQSRPRSTPTPTPSKEEQVPRPLTMEEKIAKATAASSARIQAIMDGRVEAIMDLIERTGDPVIRDEVATSLGLTVNQAVQALNHGIKAGVLFTRRATGAEYEGGSAGTRTKALYHHENPVPVRKALLKPRIHHTFPTATEPIEETTVPTEDVTYIKTLAEKQAPTVALDPDIPSIQVLRTKPDGSLVLIDAAGDLYLARKVEV